MPPETKKAARPPQRRWRTAFSGEMGLYVFFTPKQCSGAGKLRAFTSAA